MTWIPERDENGFAKFKNQVAGIDKRYEPRSFDWWIGKYNSLYNRKESGGGTVETADDYGDASLKFYDSDLVELVKGEQETEEEFQTRLNQNCTSTKVIWVPQYQHYLIGANVQVLNTPNFNTYLWAYVDFSAYGLGYIPYLQGGWNLRFFLDKHPFSIDARTTNDTPLPATIPVVFLIRHNLVTDENRFAVQIYLEHYR